MSRRLITSVHMELFNPSPSRSAGGGVGSGGAGEDGFPRREMGGHVLKIRES
jgi:hypothetical protein